MTRKAGGESLRWFRCSDYVIDDDGLIRPKPNAKVIPDAVWQQYHSANSKSQRQDRTDTTGEAPYLDLLRLDRELASLDDNIIFGGDPIRLSPDQERAVLRFVRRHGPLGIFHQTAFQVMQPGSQRVWLHRHAEWVAEDSNIFSDNTTCLTFGFVGGDVLQPKSFQQLADRFFLPEMPTPLPNPMSEEFFRNYSEPVRDFVLAVQWFHMAVSGVFNDDDWSTVNDLVLPMSFCGRGPDAQPRYGSLIAALTDMFARDVEDGFRIRHCSEPECMDIMRTKSKRALYCSRQCQWNAIQKAYRKRLATGTKKKRTTTRKVK